MIGWIIISLIVLGMGLALRAFVNAPAGFQDENGFHYGQPPDDGA